MTLPEITQQLTALTAKSPNFLGGDSLRFAFPEGIVHIDEAGQVTNEDKDASCTLSTTLSDLEKIMSGDLNPMAAVMTGKLKIKGDMGVAMKLQSLFS